MNKQKELPNVKLQKSSVIFMQLGLILAMLIVYIILEHETYYKPSTIAMHVPTEDPDDDPAIKEFVIEKPKVNKKVSFKKAIKQLPIQKSKAADTFETVKNESDKKETPDVLAPIDDLPDEFKPITAGDIGEVEEPEFIENDLPFNVVEFAPEYPGCKGSKEEKKNCFNDKINKFVQRKFNSEIAQEIGLSEGVKRINVQFIIDKQGEIVDVKVRAPHKRLEKEARRVINLLPKMKPAKQGKNNARVRFNLPIKFSVEE